MFESIRCWVVAIQPSKRSHPEHAARVFFNRSNRIVDETGRVIRVSSITDKCFRYRVEAVQYAAPCPDPKIAILVFGHAKDTVMTDRTRVIWIVLKDMNGISVVTV